MHQSSINKLKEILAAKGILSRDSLTMAKILLTAEILLKKGMLCNCVKTELTEDLRMIFPEAFTKVLGNYLEHNDSVVDDCYKEFKFHLAVYDYRYEEENNVIDTITKHNFYGVYSFYENTITDVIVAWILSSGENITSAYLPFNHLLSADEKLLSKSPKLHAPFINYDNELIKLLYLVLKDKKDSHVDSSLKGYLPYLSDFQKEYVREGVSYDCGFSCPPLAGNFEVNEVRHTSDIAFAHDMFHKVNGRFAVIVRSGFANAYTKEMKVDRKTYINSGRLVAVVLLPSGFLVGSGIITLALLFDKRGAQHDHIMMLDLSTKECFEKGKTGRQMVVLNEFAKETLSNALEGKESAIAKSILRSQIIDHDFNLSPNTYLINTKDKLAKYGDRSIKFFEVAEIYRAQALEKEESGKEYYEINVADINRLGLVEQPKKTVALCDHRIEKNLVHKGDILLAIKGAVGKVGFVDTECDNWIAGQSFVIIRPKEVGWTPEFLFWQLNSQTVYKYFKGAASGAVIPLLRKGTVSALNLLAPTEKLKAHAAKMLHKKKEIYTQIQKLNAKLEELEALV